MEFYPRYVGDLLRDTSHLDMEEFGCYSILLDWYYANECAIPVDKVWIICRARTTKQRKIASKIVSEFFTQVSGHWINTRCDTEIAKYLDKSNKAAGSARARWDKIRNADAMRTHSEGNANQNQSKNHIDIPSMCNLNKIKVVRDIDFSKWPTVPTNPTMVGWLAVRIDRGLPVTQEIMDVIATELHKAQLAGFSAESCIWYAAAKKWAGFRFAWMRKEMLAGNNPPDMPANLLAKLEDRSWAEGSLVDAKDEGAPE